VIRLVEDVKTLADRSKCFPSVCPSKVKLRTEKPLIGSGQGCHWWYLHAGDGTPSPQEHTSNCPVLRKLLDLALLRVYVTVAYPALQTAGPAAVQLNFNAGGIRLVGVFIYRLTIALSLGRDQIVNRVAETLLEA